jgi:hypothetical protein
MRSSILLVKHQPSNFVVVLRRQFAYFRYPVVKRACVNGSGV